MTIMGIIIIILSQTINLGSAEYSDEGTNFKNVILICGIIFTAYGGFVSVNKYLKDKEKKE
jgi:arginine exporter protein ArgO